MGATLSHLCTTGKLIVQWCLLTIVFLFHCCCKCGRPAPCPDGDGIRVLKHLPDANLERARAEGRAFLQQHGSNFADIKFPTPSKWKGKSVTWKRSQEISKGVTMFGENGPSPNDVKQGMLGTCYFLSAISSLAERPRHITRLYVGSNSDGTAHCVLFFRNGCWKAVTVDDRFPELTSKKGAMAACKSLGHPDGSWLWPCIFEKAWAKLNGGYLKVEGGQPMYALHCLTGLPTVRFDLKNYGKEDIWEVVREAKDTSSVVCASIENISMCGSLIPFNVLGACTTACFRGCVKKGLTCRLMYAWMDVTWRLISAILWLPFYLIPGFADCLILVINRCLTGLVSRHAYSVIEATVVPFCCTTKRLVRVRNPWGTGEWHRGWSDRSCWWCLCPKAKDVTGHDGKFHNDGMFWMALEDFTAYFSCVSLVAVARQPDDKGDIVDNVACEDGGDEADVEAAQPHPVGDFGTDGLSSLTYECEMDNAAGAGCKMTVPGEAGTVVGVWVGTDTPGENDHNGVAKARHTVKVWQDNTCVGSSPVPTLSQDPLNPEYMPFAHMATRRMELIAGTPYLVSVHYLKQKGKRKINLTFVAEGDSAPTLG